LKKAAINHTTHSNYNHRTPSLENVRLIYTYISRTKHQISRIFNSTYCFYRVTTVSTWP